MSNNQQLTQGSKHSQNMMTHQSNQENFKFSLTEFCTNSQDKLLKLKEDITNLEKEREALKKDINTAVLEDGNLQELNKDLALRIKGMKEKINAEQRRKGKLQFEIKELNKQKENVTREIEGMKNDNSYKVKIMENDIEHIHVVKENNMNITRKKIEAELATQNDLLQEIEEAKTSIDNYNRMINDFHQQAEKDEDVVKQSADMAKFLSQI